MDEQRDNSGMLFVNDRKTKDTHPDRSGSAMIDGREYWMSGWIKKGAKGQFLTLSFKPKQTEEARVPGSVDTAIDLNDQIPW